MDATASLDPAPFIQTLPQSAPIYFNADWRSARDRS